jgi:hypothetical protein
MNVSGLSGVENKRIRQLTARSEPEYKSCLKCGNIMSQLYFLIIVKL